ncbi:MAG: hypothetical protein U9R25_16835 [Chloroflexota bacterium]|nr:hypothetical protein [Chloroflexota bacterium]
MFNPYFFTILLYVFLAVLGALDASLVGYEVIPWVNGLRWMRIHLVTLGIMTQFIFAVAPALVALRSNLPRPKFRWDIWATLNVGMMALLYGIPLVNLPVILVGGTLIFIAATLLMWQLYQMRRQRKTPVAGSGAFADPHTGRKFYIAGLSYLLFGIFIGTGLWMGLPGLLRMATPVEVHIHANNWGFMSLVFAGLIVDAYPRFAGRPLAWPRSITPIFWLMVFGALGLTLGPWFKSLYFTVPGLLLHLAGTIWLVLNVVKPLLGDRKAWTPGMWHLVSAYFWILAPVLTAPFVILGVPGIAGHAVEANAPQALIYGWVLQVGYALLPYFVRRTLQPDQPARLGGNWFSLVTVNLGGLFLWLSIFITPAYGLLLGTAYALWALSLLPIARELFQSLRQGMDRLEETVPA